MITRINLPVSFWAGASINDIKKANKYPYFAFQTHFEHRFGAVSFSHLWLQTVFIKDPSISACTYEIR